MEKRKKLARLGLRIDAEAKAEIERAAKLMGIGVTAYILKLHSDREKRVQDFMTHGDLLEVVVTPEEAAEIEGSAHKRGLEPSRYLVAAHKFLDRGAVGFCRELSDTFAHEISMILSRLPRKFSEASTSYIGETNEKA